MSISNPHRLQSYVVPSHYTLSLYPNLSTFLFDGKVDINLDIQEPITVLELNSLDLNIRLEDVRLKAIETVESVECNVEIDIVSIHLDQGHERLEMTLKSPFKGKALLCINFNATLRNDLCGFYRAQYEDNSDSKERKECEQMKWCALTQFEATSARKCFPCFDEPMFKATYDVTIHIPIEMTTVPNFTCLSNTDVKEIIENTNTCCREYHFQRTPKISTYLLAFTIGEFHSLEQTTKQGLIMRVWATSKEKVKQAVFALDVSVRAMEFYHEYFEFPYYMNKIDLVAAPEFSAGAMENQSLVLFKETYLLADENASNRALRNIVTIVCHELGHMYFGNLVTMKFWNELYLKEAMCTLYQNLVADKLFPDWQFIQTFVSDVFSSAQSLDALVNTHPVEMEVHTPAQIDSVFDTISYEKGSVIMRMLHTWLGEETFRKAMVKYMHKYQFSNATGNDLWSVMEEVSNLPVRNFMIKWTQQEGFPVVYVCECRPSSLPFPPPLMRQSNDEDHCTLTITRSLEEEMKHKSLFIYTNEHNGNTLIVSQERFTFKSPNTSPYAEHLCYPCPLTWVVPNGFITPPSTLLEDAISTSHVPDILSKTTGWIKLNADSTSFFRTWYSPVLWERLCNAIKLRDPALSKMDRLQLQSDVFALLWSGRVRPEHLNLITHYDQEQEAIVWLDLIDNIIQIAIPIRYERHNMSEPIHNDWFDRTCDWIHRSTKPIVEKLTLHERKEDTRADKLLRGRLIELLGLWFPEYNIIHRVQTMVSDYYREVLTSNSMNSGQGLLLLSPDIRSSAFATTVRHGDVLGYQLMLDLYLHKASSQTDKGWCLSALGATRNRACFTNLMERVLQPINPEIPFYLPQDATTFFRRISQYRSEEFWEILSTHWSILERQQNGNTRQLIHIVELLANMVGRPTLCLNVKRFFKDHFIHSDDRTFCQTLECMSLNYQFIKRHKSDFKNWLRTINDKR
ncbi:MAG: putative puromycin-sensitive aminopeptidase isoform X1 [Sylvanvirus sp.]|uniref:Putative puromycin-sensitive aminopeptidase isoform X1 n=1 Tax=Sylvanvirus sp. TaxID=2487774 RepID=A0A3G5AIU7_9VIRU|nr:MAG: putative puromycin-sensitive aminopeptidase isoform X1 [Sylvanvirus sp.]